MNINRALYSILVGTVVTNAVLILKAFVGHYPFQFDILFGLITPVLAGLACGMVKSPKERANHL